MLATAVEPRPTWYYFRVPSRNGTKGAHNRQREKRTLNQTTTTTTKKSPRKDFGEAIPHSWKSHPLLLHLFWIKHFADIEFLFSLVFVSFRHFLLLLLLRCFQGDRDRSNKGRVQSVWFFASGLESSMPLCFFFSAASFSVLKLGFLWECLFSRFSANYHHCGYLSVLFLSIDNAYMKEFSYINYFAFQY